MKDFKSKILKEVLDGLNNNGIAYCVLRNYDTLPYTVKSKDVDILVERKNIKKVRALINTTVKKHDELNCEYTRREYVEFFRIYCGLECLKLDFAFNYDAKLITFLTGKKMLEYKRLHENGFYCLDTAMSACIAWHKNLFAVKKINKKYIDLIYNEYNKDKNKFIEYMNIFAGREITEKLSACLSEKQIEASQNLANDVIRYSKMVQKRRLYKILRITKHIGLEIIKRLQNGKKNLISLHGPDGAGKSTVAEALKPLMAKAICVDEDDVVIKHFRPYVLPNISVLFSRDKEKALQAIEDNISNPHEAPPAGFLSSVIRLAYYSFDYALGYWIKVFPLTSRGKIVIFDRYYIDYYIDSLRSRIKAPKFMIAFFSFFIVKPYASFVLLGDEEIYYNRKKELDKREIKRQVHEYARLSGKKKYVFGVNGESSPEEVAAEILSKYIKKRCKVI